MQPLTNNHKELYPVVNYGIQGERILYTEHSINRFILIRQVHGLKNNLEPIGLRKCKLNYGFMNI